MKKQILTVAVAALALAACSKNETVEVASNRAIGFDNFVGKITRAGETTTSSIQTNGFAVYGGSEDTKTLFSDVLVTYSGGNWTYEDTKYWMPNKTYRFAAYAPQVKNVITPTWSYDDNKLTFAITSDATNQNDLVYAVANPVSTPATITTMNPVEFSMNHILSKLNFVIARGDIETDATLTITGFKVEGDINTQGAFDGTDWAASNIATTSFTGKAEEDINDGATGEMGSFYVVPQNLTGDITVSFTVTMTVGEQQIGNPTQLEATISNPNWQKDYVYTYTATINQENIEGGVPIVFTGSVNGWTETENGNLTLE